MRKTVSRLLNGEPYTFAPVKIKQVILLGGIVGLFLACTPRAVQDAQRVVAQADTLRAEGRMYGIDEGDSLTLAQAYETLGAIPLPFREGMGLGSSYAHACFHYGRLLRQKDNPVEAMQVFIEATHSHTRDYHILGRIYSNMGSICHLAGDFPLSYDMYEKSAQVFLQGGDSLSYYYGLYRMAFELAEQGKKEETLALLNTVDSTDSQLLSLINLTKAELYKTGELYDSALYYANRVCNIPQHQLTGILIKAQSYSCLNIKDSAVYYANVLISRTNELFYINSALYILTHEDEKKNIEEVRNISADRSDVQKLIEIRQGKLSQAVQLLEQDLNRKPDWRIYILLACIVIGVILAAVSVRKWKRHKRQMQKQFVTLTSEHTNHIIESIKKHIDATNLNTTLHWKNYAAMKVDADLYIGGVVSKLEAKNLNETEIRYCVLTLLDLPQKQKAEILCYSYPSAIKTLKRRVSTKLGITSPKLQNFLFSIVTNV